MFQELRLSLVLYASNVNPFLLDPAYGELKI